MRSVLAVLRPVSPIKQNVLFPVSRGGGNIQAEVMPQTDKQLIVELNARRAEEAFAALVRQHVNLVFGTALRQVGDRGAAEEITQNVFVALARASGKLAGHPTIAGWLHQTALNKSREWLRAELRRRRREQIAVSLASARADGDSVWSPLVPLLDEALLELREPDRLAVIMHFIEGQRFHEVGSALGLGEDAVRKRVDRCLDQLTQFFRRRGFALPALVAGAPLFTLASPAAPAGLAGSATTAGLAAAHSAVSTLTLIKGALKIMAWTKAKTAAVAVTALILAAGTTTIIVTQMQNAAGPAPSPAPQPVLPTGPLADGTGPAVPVGTVADDSVFEADWNKLWSAPPNLLVLRPTRSTEVSGPLFASGQGGKGARMSGRCVSLGSVLEIAYDFPQTRMTLPADAPKGNLDFLVTVPANQREALQTEITKQFGLVARRETHDTGELLVVEKAK
jgi:RNA polymerase sigma factor (sigma-70 family)